MGSPFLGHVRLSTWWMSPQGTLRAAWWARMACSSGPSSRQYTLPSALWYSPICRTPNWSALALRTWPAICARASAGSFRSSSDEGTTPFPANALAGMRRVVRCEAVSYREWSPQEVLESSLAADDPTSILPGPGMHIRRSDRMIRSPVGHRRARCPTANGSGGKLWRSQISSAIANSAAGLYAEVCKPLGVRAVMKVFLPACRAACLLFVFDTTRSRFTETDRPPARPDPRRAVRGPVLVAAGPIADPAEAGMTWRGLLLCALDGFQVLSRSKNRIRLPAMPGEERRRCHRKDFGPLTLGEWFEDIKFLIRDRGSNFTSGYAV